MHVGIQGELDMATSPLFGELVQLVAEQSLYLLEDREEMRMSTRETPDDEERASVPGQKADGSLEPGSWPERKNGDDSGMGNAGRGKEPAEIEEGA